MRAVLDPNVIVSAALSPRGTPARLLLAWLGGDFELVISPKLIAEMERVLGYAKIRRRISQEESQELVDLLLRLASNVNDPTTEPPVRSFDPGDDYLIALAAAESSALVSGDRHLFELAGILPVYSPKDFLELIQSRD